MSRKDFGIIVLKPDGVKKGLMNECEKEISRKKISIISKKFVHLKKTDVATYFYYNIEEYINYMCEGEICVYYLESDNKDLDVEIFLIKKKIREKYGVSGRNMRNYIHGCHCGTEFFLQRKLFFPEFEKYEYSGGYDLYCNIKEIDVNTVEKLLELKEKRKLKDIVLIVEEDMLLEFQKHIANRVLETGICLSTRKEIELLERKCEIIEYLPQSSNLEKEKIVFLGKVYGMKFSVASSSTFSDYHTNNVKSMEQELNCIIGQLEEKNIYVRGILINTADMSIQEAECRYEYAMNKGYIYSGGSATLNNLGLFGMSRNKVKEVMKLLKYN